MITVIVVMMTTMTMTLLFLLPLPPPPSIELFATTSSITLFCLFCMNCFVYGSSMLSLRLVCRWADRCHSGSYGGQRTSTATATTAVKKHDICFPQLRQQVSTSVFTSSVNRQTITATTQPQQPVLHSLQV